VKTDLHAGTTIRASNRTRSYFPFDSPFSESWPLNSEVAAVSGAVVDPKKKLETHSEMLEFLLLM
jgi:hypothetical protein